MSNFEVVPYYEQSSHAPDELDRALNETAPASYDRRVRNVLALHTGSPKEYLSIEQEQELATLIQNGRAAQAERQDSEAHVSTQSELPRRSKDGNLDPVERGRQAEQKLIECHLKFSAYLARASMNILPEGDDQASIDSKAGKRRQALRNNRPR